MDKRYDPKPQIAQGHLREVDVGGHLVNEGSDEVLKSRTHGYIRPSAACPTQLASSGMASNCVMKRDEVSHLVEANANPEERPVEWSRGHRRRSSGQ
jgi:hypothetical protein